MSATGHVSKDKNSLVWSANVLERKTLSMFIRFCQEDELFFILMNK